MGNLHEHAERELRRIGGGGYDGMIDKAVMELVDTFSVQGHSGGSAMQTLAIFDRVAQFKVLSPLTDDPDEWMLVAEPANTWQSRRQSSCFSRDGGKSWYDIDEPDRWWVPAWRFLGGRWHPKMHPAEKVATASEG